MYGSDNWVGTEKLGAAITTLTHRDSDGQSLPGRSLDPGKSQFMLFNATTVLRRSSRLIAKTVNVPERDSARDEPGWKMRGEAPVRLSNQGARESLHMTCFKAGNHLAAGIK